MIASATISSISVKPLRACNFPRNGSPFSFVFVPAPPGFSGFGAHPKLYVLPRGFSISARESPGVFPKTHTAGRALFFKQYF